MTENEPQLFRINNALRADPVIGKHMREKDMKLTMDTLLEDLKDEAKEDLSRSQQFRLYYNGYRMDGFSFFEAFKKATLGSFGLDRKKRAF